MMLACVLAPQEHGPCDTHTGLPQNVVLRFICLPVGRTQILNIDSVLKTPVIKAMLGI